MDISSLDLETLPLNFRKRVGCDLYFSDGDEVLDVLSNQIPVPIVLGLPCTDLEMYRSTRLVLTFPAEGNVRLYRTGDHPDNLIDEINNNAYEAPPVIDFAGGYFLSPWLFIQSLPKDLDAWIKGKNLRIHYIIRDAAKGLSGVIIRACRMDNPLYRDSESVEIFHFNLYPKSEIEKTWENNKNTKLLGKFVPRFEEAIDRNGEIEKGIHILQWRPTNQNLVRFAG